MCEMCMTRGCLGGEGMSVLGLGFTNPVGTECWTCVCFGGEWVEGLEQGLEEWGVVMSV